LLDLNNSEAKPLFDTEHDYAYPNFSPDGQWLAYTSSESGRDEVWAISFPDRERRIPISNDGGLAPRWSPDGREIYYRAGHRLMVVEVTRGPELILGKPHPLFEVGFDSGGPLRGYDITPDGERFIFKTPPETDPDTPPVRQLQVVLNWFDELERLAPTN